MSQILKLKKILDEDSEDVNINVNGAEFETGEDDGQNEAPKGYCVECKDQRAVMFCENCAEDFCEVCYTIIHRNGSRKKHVFVMLEGSKKGKDDVIMEDVKPSLDEQPDINSTENHIGASEINFENMSEVVAIEGEDSFSEWIMQRARFIPMRLTPRERKKMRLLDAALSVSEYTDKIDVLSYGNKAKRIVGQIQEICAILSGLLLATDYKAGQVLFEDRQFDENRHVFQEIFEIGRRYKLMNPQKMKNTYGKLMYLLQDSTNPDVEDILGFNMIVPIKTVYDVLDEYGVIHVLEDKTVATATQEIIPEGKSRSQVQAEIKRKEHAIEYLSRTYSTSSCPAEVIKQCLYSIGDNHAFLRFNRDPCDKIANCLTKYFTHSEAESEELSLAILSGKDGARLSHSHETQYFYVLQTLTLWKEILHEFYMLWHFSDSDMLSKRNQYRLRDTGQGLNRVQECPLVSRAVHSILHKIQKRSRRWVGSSVIHLGDRNVPNAFMFIDKYSQISSILNPIVRCIEYIDTISKSTKPSGKKSTNPSRANSGSDEQSDENSNSPENDSLDSTQIKKSSSRLRLSNVFSSKITMNPFDLLSSYTNYSMGKKRPSKTTQINLNAIRAYIDYAFGGPTMLKKLILADFFRSAFDGSGADNFFEAGSCIDGRLTSAWNWCSLVEKKSFFPIFLLSGFVGFNGGE